MGLRSSSEVGSEEEKLVSIRKSNELEFRLIV
jgi:hypothetical protein